jgi:hypothetical protein
MSMKNFALMFDTHMEWLSQQIIDENANTTELGRQLQAASEARINWLRERQKTNDEARRVMTQHYTDMVGRLDHGDKILDEEIQAEMARAAASAAEIEARHAALNAILEGPRDTDKAAA